MLMGALSHTEQGIAPQKHLIKKPEKQMNRATFGRIAYLDILKALAIIMVCTYHAPLTLSFMQWHEPPTMSLELQRFIWGMLSPCVPLFFMVTGTLLMGSRRPIRLKHHLKKIAHILVQFLVWQAITLAVIALWQGVNVFDNGLGAFVSTILFNARDIGIPLNHLWFIPTYIAVSLLLPFFAFAFAQWDNQAANAGFYIIGFLIILILLLFIVPDIQRGLDFVNLGSISMDGLHSFAAFETGCGVMLTYSLLGPVLQRLLGSSSSKKPPRILWIFTFLLGACLLHLRWNFECAISGATWDNVFDGYGTIGTLLMTSSIYLFATGVNETNYYTKHSRLSSSVELISKNTLSIYYIHWIAIYTIWIPCATFFARFSPAVQWGVTLTKGIVLVLLCILVSSILQRIPVVRFPVQR